MRKANFWKHLHSYETLNIICLLGQIQILKFSVENNEIFDYYSMAIYFQEGGGSSKHSSSLFSRLGRTKASLGWIGKVGGNGKNEEGRWGGVLWLKAQVWDICVIGSWLICEL